MKYVFMIYKSLMESGRQYKIEVKEYCATEQEAISNSKLYNLQIPLDLRDRYKYYYASSSVN